MGSNIYKPPKSDVAVADNKPGSTVKAVLSGIAVEIVGTLAVGMAIGIAYGVMLSAQGLSPEQIQSMLTKLDPLSGIGLVGTVLGTLVSVLAGYICAKIANRVSFKPPLILSGISFVLGVVTGFGAYSWLALIAVGVISVGAVMFGAWLYIRGLQSVSESR